MVSPANTEWPTDPWRVAPVDEVIWDCDVAANYDTPLAKYLTSPPATSLYRRRCRRRRALVPPGIL